MIDFCVIYFFNTHCSLKFILISELNESVRLLLRVKQTNSITRPILPKKTNFDNLIQKDMDLITPSINSYKRAGSHGLSPHDTFVYYN